MIESPTIIPANEIAKYITDLGGQADWVSTLQGYGAVEVLWGYNRDVKYYGTDEQLCEMLIKDWIEDEK
jgi:hypothetical protein